MSDMTFETLTVDVADGIAWVTVNRPEKRNALNATVRRELLDAFDALAAHDDARVVVITGAGERAFSAGADLDWMRAAVPSAFPAMRMNAVAASSTMLTRRFH